MGDEAIANNGMIFLWNESFFSLRSFLANVIAYEDYKPSLICLTHESHFLILLLLALDILHLLRSISSDKSGFNMEGHASGCGHTTMLRNAITGCRIVQQ